MIRTAKRSILISDHYWLINLVKQRSHWLWGAWRAALWHGDRPPAPSSRRLKTHEDDSKRLRSRLWSGKPHRAVAGGRSVEAALLLAAAARVSDSSSAPSVRLFSRVSLLVAPAENKTKVTHKKFRRSIDDDYTRIPWRCSWGIARARPSICSADNSPTAATELH